MKAIILAGSENILLHPLTRSCPKSMLPFLNRPLLELQLRWLGQNGFKEVGIVLSPQDAERVRNHLGEGGEFHLRIFYAIDDVPRGPAGCLKLFEQFIGDDFFLVVDGNVYMDSIDLSGLLNFHFARKNILTLGVDENRSNSKDIENIVESEDGRIQCLQILHPSKDQRRHRKSNGIYLFDSRILGFISNKGYVDIKEQLTADLYQAGYMVSGYLMKGLNACVDNIPSYYQFQHDILRRGTFERNDCIEIGDQIWIDRDTQVSSSAYLLGPIFIGKSCIIETHAQIIGPTVIGDYSRIGEGSLIRESIVWDHARISKHSKVEYSVIGSECYIPSDRRVKESVMMSDFAPVEDSFAEHSQKSDQRMMQTHDLSAQIRYLSGKGAKRIIDLIVSSLGLVVCAAFFLLIAIAIKLDSPGPVFYRQRRCGKNGREFRMIKFRTMIQDAEDLQEKLYAQKDVDGPVFKLFNDPRVTRFGSLLRRTSLDELPQLINVLKGEMSLVGPRPLIMDEMRFSPSWRDARLRVKPGITGLWQLHSRSQPEFHEWIRYDIEYVKRQSFMLDLKILIKTALVVLRGI